MEMARGSPGPSVSWTGLAQEFSIYQGERKPAREFEAYNCDVHCLPQRELAAGKLVGVCPAPAGEDGGASEGLEAKGASNHVNILTGRRTSRGSEGSDEGDEQKIQDFGLSAWVDGGGTQEGGEM